MSAYYEADIKSVTATPYKLWNDGDTVEQRLVKVKAAMGVVVVGGKNVCAPEDAPVKEPLLSKLPTDQKTRLADLLDAMIKTSG